jgi:hypothetical protein
MDFPEIFKGTPTPAKWAALGEFLQAGSISGGPGLRVRRVGNKTVITTRRRSHGGAAGESILNPWQPVFFTTGSGEALVYKCRINLGTVNNVAASNWNAEHTLPSADDVFKFVVLTVTTASGKVTSISISIDAAPPETDEVAQDVPPVSHKILLGAIGRNSARMIITTNLQMTGVEVFRETKAAPAVGAEPFNRWWRWEHTSV